MARVVVTKKCDVQNGPTLEHLKAGDVVEASSTVQTAITSAGGTFRNVSNSGGAAGMRDQLGESFAASNATP